MMISPSGPRNLAPAAEVAPAEIDERAFARLTARHRRELQVHCYRMVGSLQDAEDLVQETFLRAWRRRETYAGRATFRAWLYRIATNSCLDHIDRRNRRPDAATGEVLYLQPYPDELLAEIADPAAGPADTLVARETIELAFLVAIQHLAPRARAALLFRDVLGFTARETAELLDTTVASVNSALQRARAGMEEHLPQRRAEWPAGTDATAAQRELLQRYVETSERGDAQGLAALLHEGVRFSMPPQPGTWTGRDEVVAGWVSGGFGSPDWGALRCLVTAANRQPAVACYHRGPDDGTWRALAVDVLRIEDGLVREIVTFDASAFASFGLAAALD